MWWVRVLGIYDSLQSLESTYLLAARGIVLTFMPTHVFRFIIFPSVPYNIREVVLGAVK